MWDLIVSVPDHCLSFYLEKLHKIDSKNVSKLTGGKHHEAKAKVPKLLALMKNIIAWMHI